jgi:Glucose-6-phosphate dehydrogenase, NAD binding domain
VVPALYHLVQAGKLPDRFAIIGVDQNDQTTAQWHQNLTNMIQTLTPAGEIAAPAWSWLTDRIHYMPADFTQSETFRHLERPLQGALRTLFTSVQASLFRVRSGIPGRVSSYWLVGAFRSNLYAGCPRLDAGAPPIDLVLTGPVLPCGCVTFPLGSVLLVANIRLVMEGASAHDSKAHLRMSQLAFTCG